MVRTEPFHPDLKGARFLPRTTVLRWNLPALRTAERLASRSSAGPVDVVPVDSHSTVRVHRPAGLEPLVPALLWIHGGGLVLGTAAQDDRLCRAVADELGIIVASVDYRRAPEHQFPAALDDCYAALSWLAQQPDVRPDKIAVGGASAGGGLAAAVALAARDRPGPRAVFQLLVYPMLDDRTGHRPGRPNRSLRVWSERSNRFGWHSYLGTRSGAEVPALAAPARAEDVGGLPPAWIGVGSNDLFYSEDLAYADRLRAAGVDCEAEVVTGAYHGFDMIHARAAVSRAFGRSRDDALRRALLADP